MSHKKGYRYIKNEENLREKHHFIINDTKRTIEQ